MLDLVPNQSLNPYSLHWKCSLNQWTTREVLMHSPLISLFFLSLYLSSQLSPSPMSSSLFIFLSPSPQQPPKSKFCVFACLPPHFIPCRMYIPISGLPLLPRPNLICSPHKRLMNKRWGAEAKNRDFMQKASWWRTWQKMSQNNYLIRVWMPGSFTEPERGAVSHSSQKTE